MGSDFDSRYRQAAAARLRAAAAQQSAAASAASQTARARQLAGPAISDFTASAVKVLRSEGVWCRDAWYLPGIDRDVTFTLDRHRSGPFRKAWKFESPGSFVSLSKDGLLRSTSVPANVHPDDALFTGMAIGGKDVWQSLQPTRDSNSTPPPRLFFNTESSSLSVVWEGLSGQMQSQPFMDYGAAAVESLVTGWRNRKG